MIAIIFKSNLIIKRKDLIMTVVSPTSLLDKGIKLVTSPEFLIGAGTGALLTLSGVVVKNTYFPSNSKKSSTTKKKKNRVVRAVQKVVKHVKSSGNRKAQAASEKAKVAKVAE